MPVDARLLNLSAAESRIKFSAGGRIVVYFEDNFKLSGIIGTSWLARPNSKGHFWLNLKLDASSEEVLRSEQLRVGTKDGYTLLMSSASKGPVVVETENGNPHTKYIRTGSSVEVSLSKYPGPSYWMTILRTVVVRDSPSQEG